MNLIKKTKKGFTLVELVVVIAIIAILSGVSVAVYIGINERAKLSNDVSVCKNMNTTLKANQVLEGVPEDIIATKTVLNADFKNDYVPQSNSYHYYWNEDVNTVFLVNDKNNSFSIYYPENDTDLTITNDKSYRLDKDYWRLISNIEGVSFDKNVIEKNTENFIEIKGEYSSNRISINNKVYTVNDHKITLSADFDGGDGNLTFEFAESQNEGSGGHEVDCLIKGTKITTKNGGIKNIEDIKKGDEILTFNHEKGIYESQKVYLAWKGEDVKCAFTLHFSNNIELSVIGDHCLFEKESLKYVSIFDYNADEFVGKHFYNSIDKRYEELLFVTYDNEPTEYYEIYTEYNANCIANSMLNVALDSSELLNIYDFNEDLSINHQNLENDILRYGLYEYQEDANYSKHIFDIMGWKYLNIIIGKGLGTWEDFYSRKDAFLSMYNE